MIKLINPNTRQFLFTPLGFSWTNFFFGAWVPLFRGEGGFFWVYSLAGAFSLGIFNIVMWFTYNKGFILRKITKGWVPADPQTQNILLAHGIVCSTVDVEDRSNFTPFKPNKLGFYLYIIFTIFSIFSIAVALATVETTY